MPRSDTFSYQLKHLLHKIGVETVLVREHSKSRYLLAFALRIGRR